MNKFKCISILFFISLIITTGCKAINDSKNNNHDGNNIGVIFSSSKTFFQKGKKDPGIRSIYNIKPGEYFSGTYSIRNDANKKDFIIIAYFDYQPVNFNLGNSRPDIKQLISLKSKEEKHFKFSVGPVKKGFHDFTMLAFADPFNHSTGDWRLYSDMTVYYPQLANLISGKVLANNIRLNVITDQIKGELEFTGALNKKNKSNKFEVWKKEIVKPGQKVDYFLHVGNETNKKKKFILTTLLNYKMIKVLNGKPEQLVIELEPKTRAMIPVNFIAPKKKGTYELLTLKSNGPFILHSKKNLKNTDDRIISSPRTAIIVK